MSNSLKIIEVEGNATKASKNNLREKTEEKFNLLWKENSSSFDPLTTALGKERIKRTKEIIESSLNLENENIVDLGSGWGTLTKYYLSKEAFVHAVDISNEALLNLKNLNNPKLTLSQDYIPNTLLKDNSFNIVSATEIIGYLNPQQYRLFFSECSRLMQNNGQVIISTALDVNSEDALEKFISLAETEFKILYHRFSFHAYYLKLIELFSKAFFLKPLVNFLKQNEKILLLLEKICKFIKDEDGITHIIIIGIKKPLFENLKEEEKPVERKEKRQVWE